MRSTQSGENYAGQDDHSGYDDKQVEFFDLHPLSPLSGELYRVDFVLPELLFDSIKAVRIPKLQKSSNISTKLSLTVFC
jgi:hypothetical protein